MVYIEIVRPLSFSLREIHPIPSELVPEGLSEACVGFYGPALECCDVDGFYYIINPDHLNSHLKTKCPEGIKWIKRVFIQHTNFLVIRKIYVRVL